MILALDLSLTASGWARSDGQSGVIVPKGEFARGIDRLRWIRWSVCRLLETGAFSVALSRVELVVIEGYAFGVQGQQGHISLGELGGVVRCALADRDIPFVEIPPSSLKMFATGKGNAKKEAVLVAAIQKLKYGGNSTDEADALWLLEMAHTYYGGRAESAPDPQFRALSKTTWPKLGYTRGNRITPIALEL